MNATNQKELADLVKQINWLRQNPKVTQEQLDQLKELLEQGVRALSS